jgi:hypothetical protein
MTNAETGNKFTFNQNCTVKFTRIGKHNIDSDDYDCVEGTQYFKKGQSIIVDVLCHENDTYQLGLVKDGKTVYDVPQYLIDIKSLTSEEQLRGMTLNVANPIHYGAQEYLCAMTVLDDLKVPRNNEGKQFSLVGRINEALTMKEQGKLVTSTEIKNSDSPFAHLFQDNG